MKENSTTRLDKLAELFPEAAEAIRNVKAEQAASRSPEARETPKQCRSWPEAWVYVFHQATLHHRKFLQWDKDKIIRVVWPVPDFDDTIVDMLIEISHNIGVDNDLVELRLIDTKVSIAGIEKLKLIFPKAGIHVYTREQADKDETLEYINTDVKWIKELHSKKSGDEPAS